jgi:FkbM family methyltransferase
LNLTDFRIWIIKGLIDINEKLFFNKKILSYYKNKGLNTIIDVGANKGQSIDIFLKINPKCCIYAFEPNPSLFNHLLEKYKNSKNVKIFNLGISDTDGEKIFYQNTLDYTSSFEEINMNSKYLIKKSEILRIDKNALVSDKYFVKTITLNNFIKNHIPNQEVDLIKIDTEGHEYYCLLGLFSEEKSFKIKYIQLEFQHNDMYLNKVHLNKIDNILIANNFKLMKKIKHGFGNFDELIYSLEHIKIE